VFLFCFTSIRLKKFPDIGLQRNTKAIRDAANIISMVDSTKVLCPLFDKIDILIPGDSPNSSLSVFKHFIFSVDLYEFVTC